jgi:hypothetical protein
MKKSLSSLIVMLFLAATIPTSSARADDWSGYPASTKVGAGLASVLYFPAKLVFAAGGAVASGVTYVATLGRHEPADRIWNAAVEGDYVVTPSMIEGRRHVDFVGPNS